MALMEPSPVKGTWRWAVINPSSAGVTLYQTVELTVKPLQNSSSGSIVASVVSCVSMKEGSLTTVPGKSSLRGTAFGPVSIDPSGPGLGESVVSMMLKSKKKVSSPLLLMVNCSLVVSSRSRTTSITNGSTPIDDGETSGSGSDAEPEPPPPAAMMKEKLSARAKIRGRA